MRVWLSVVLLFASFGFSSPAVINSGTLRDEIHKLADALNHRDLAAIRTQISPSRIFVEIADRPGAYLTSSQTVVVMESFIRTRTSISSSFDFVNDDGFEGSASGTLAARKDGLPVSYKLNFGFTKDSKGKWLLTKISMK